MLKAESFARAATMLDRIAGSEYLSSGVRVYVLETSEVLDMVGNLITHLKAFSAKLPAVVPMASVPGGVKPTVEAVDAYEQTVSRFREHAASQEYRRLNVVFIEVLEAFESGLVLRTVQGLLMALDQLELMARERSITVLPAEQARLQEYRNTLNKILPGSQPELKGSGGGM